MSASNLLKTFGAGANVAAQLATDRSLRRKTTETKRAVGGESSALVAQSTPPAVIDWEFNAFDYEPGTTNTLIPHGLSVVPSGAVVVFIEGDQHAATDLVCIAVDETNITMHANVAPAGGINLPIRILVV